MNSSNGSGRPRRIIGVALVRALLTSGLISLFLLGLPQLAHAESLLSMRESVLTQQRDRILISFQARIGPIGRVHGINGGEDCDVHVPLRTQTLFLAVLGEIKNACAMGPTRAALEAMGPGPMSVRGAFRIWFEGHDDGKPFREENRKVPKSYVNSGPPHLVEVHPVTRLGGFDLLGNVRFIEKNGKTIGWKTGQSLRRAVDTQITIQRRTIGSSRYILVRCTCPKLANHYRLTIEIVEAAHATDNADGVVAAGKVFGENGAVLLTQGRLFAIDGTPAADVLRAVSPGDRLIVYVLARLSLRPLLDRVTSSATTINLPTELLLLHAERP